METALSMTQKEKFHIKTHPIQFQVTLYLHNISFEEPLEQVCSSIIGPWEYSDCAYSFFFLYDDPRPERSI